MAALLPPFGSSPVVRTVSGTGHTLQAGHTVRTVARTDHTVVLLAVDLPDPPVIVGKAVAVRGGADRTAAVDPVQAVGRTDAAVAVAQELAGQEIDQAVELDPAVLADAEETDPPAVVAQVSAVVVRVPAIVVRVLGPVQEKVPVAQDDDRTGVRVALAAVLRKLQFLAVHDTVEDRHGRSRGVADTAAAAETSTVSFRPGSRKAVHAATRPFPTVSAASASKRRADRHVLLDHHRLFLPYLERCLQLPFEVQGRRRREDAYPFLLLPPLGTEADPADCHPVS